MKAIRAHEWCTPRGLTIDEIDQPQPADRQILVRVNAAGLNFPDLLIITGKYQFKPALPFSPGFEIAGTVEKIGPAVTKFSEGQREVCLFEGCCYGKVCSLPWAVRFPRTHVTGGVPVHPTELYEAAGNLLIFTGLSMYYCRKRW